MNIKTRCIAWAITLGIIEYSMFGLMFYLWYMCIPHIKSEILQNVIICGSIIIYSLLFIYMMDAISRYFRIKLYE